MKLTKEERKEIELRALILAARTADFELGLFGAATKMFEAHNELNRYLDSITERAP